MNIELAAETIGHIGFFPITNTLLVSWIAMILLISTSFFATRKIQIVPAGLQNFYELIIEVGFGIVDDLAPLKAKIFFPMVMTFFLFIVTGNWLGLFPGFGTIGFTEIINGKEIFVPYLRSINADLNTTLALALISAITTHYFAVKYLGVKDYLGHWFTLNPIYLFVGMMELVGEFTKIISLSFRLFGNIFAGEVVLSTIGNIFAFVLPLPFYFLEIIVGFVQGAVFMMLTLVFMVLLSQKHAEEH